MLWQDDPFFQYPRTSAHTSEGEVALPILYPDASSFGAFFFVDYRAARDMLAPHAVQPVHFGRSRALAGFHCYDYRDSTIGPYREAGLVLAAVPLDAPSPVLPLLSLFTSPDRKAAGFFILDLPVTTSIANAAGRELWGYPKFVTQIGFTLDEGRVDGSVAGPNPATTLARLAGRPGPGMPIPLADLVLYSRRDGHLLRAVVNVQGAASACLPGSVRLDSTAGEHPLARHIAALGLAGARPAVLLACRRLRMRLNAGALVPQRQFMEPEKAGSESSASE